MSLAPQLFDYQTLPLSVDAGGLFDIDYLHEFHLCRLRESFGLDRRRDSKKMCPANNRLFVVKNNVTIFAVNYF
jgi:hypothetical protein